MDQLVLFIQTNWQVIASLVIGLATLLITILKKKVKIIDTIKEFILAKLPDVINLTEFVYSSEEHCFFSSKKKDFAIDTMKNILVNEFGCNPDRYISFISDSIESILATPQKKGE